MKLAIEITKKQLITFFVALGVTLSLVWISYYFYVSNRTFEYNGRRYHPGESFKSADGCNTCSFDENGQMMCTLMACDTDDSDLDQSINIAFSHHDGAYYYSGMIQKPTPCDTVSSDYVIRESYPEQVDLNFTIQSSDQICAQVISDEPVSGQIPVSEKAKIQVYINGELQPGKGINE